MGKGLWGKVYGEKFMGKDLWGKCLSLTPVVPFSGSYSVMSPVASYVMASYVIASYVIAYYVTAFLCRCLCQACFNVNQPTPSYMWGLPPARYSLLVMAQQQVIHGRKWTLAKVDLACEAGIPRQV